MYKNTSMMDPFINFDLKDVVEELALIMAPEAHTKNLEIAYWLAPDVESALIGDPIRLKQVIANLVNHAVKSTEKGEIFIRITRENNTPDSTKIRLEVRYTGTNIPSDVRETLSISKKLIMEMGGNFGIDATVGKNPTLWFTVRLQKQKNPKKKKTPRLSKLGTTRALIIDDNETHRNILHEQLANWGVSSEMAGTWEQTQALVEEAVKTREPYQLIILDMQMPDMDGLTMAKKLRERPDLLSTPIISLFSLEALMDHDNLEKLNIQRSLSKPVQRGVLFITLQQILKSGHASKNGASKRKG